MAMLRRGLSGEPVRILQSKLGIEADGIFGKNTEAALRAYQKANGLAVDGIAGPDTFMKMNLYELVLLMRPIKGNLVKRVQDLLGIDADGIFGKATEEAVRAWQKANGHEVTGDVGPEMLAALGFAEFTPDTVEASIVSAETPPIDEAKVAAVAAAEPPAPPPPPSFVSKAGDFVAQSIVGTSVWATVKKVF